MSEAEAAEGRLSPVGFRPSAEDKSRQREGPRSSLSPAEGRQPTADSRPSIAIPRATYRLQLHAGFTFNSATATIPYLARLGISHVYVSPYFRARPGSTHGYDVVDHAALNPELGTQEDFERFLAELRAHGLGQILDIVPNHVGVMGADNTRWMDVLENGQASVHAEVFDIDWEPADPALAGKLLVPVLGDVYGRILERGEIVVRFERDTGGFAAFYYDHRLPIDPREYPRILTRALALVSGDALALEDREDFASLIDAFGRLPRRDNADAQRISERQRDKEVHKRRLLRLLGRAPAIEPAIEAALAELNRPDADALHELLEAQAYRLAFWRVAPDEINYRRFFDINDLAALRMENDAVFDDAHAFALSLVERGVVQGLRIDHPDGLYDPARYFARLRSRAPGAYIVAEKITAGFEDMPADWPVQGTTGYRFANIVNGLTVDGGARGRMDRIYRGFVGGSRDWADIAYEAKRQIVGSSLAAELNVIANQLARLARADRNSRDFTLNSLRRALTEVIACFPVYRTYVAAEVHADDRKYVDWAIAAARRRGRATDAAVFDFVRAALLDELPAPDERSRRAARVFAMKFQQVTAPVTAKGVEDTALYRFVRLVSLNEVGGDPSAFGTSVAAFHADAKRRLQRWPHEMIAASTHDTKRSEDVRARIDVLSELSGEWRRALEKWSRLNRTRKREVDGQSAPSAYDEYLLYQTLIGSWPLGKPADAELAEYRRRIEAYALKAAREAKVRTSWFAAQAEYEEALTQFVRSVLEPRDANLFIADLTAFVARSARFGLWNALTQTLLRLTVPGVPDTYQGTELWDFSLVDPDNRRPVDYELRMRLLAELPRADDAQAVRALAEAPEDPRTKLYLMVRALAVRREHEALFREGDYLPLQARGSQAAHIVAFARRRGDEVAVTIAPRLYVRLVGDRASAPLGREVWTDTYVEMPRAVVGTRLVNALDARTTIAAEVGDAVHLSIGEVLSSFPVALLTKA
jgi:(1->4)-alpha-D-glucan 1-alpha-D-glucosylmutase